MTVRSSTDSHDPIVALLQADSEPDNFDLVNQVYELTSIGDGDRGAVTSNGREPSWRRFVPTFLFSRKQRRRSLEENYQDAPSSQRNARTKKRRKLSRWCMILAGGTILVLGLIQLLHLLSGLSVVVLPEHIHRVLESWGQIGKVDDGLRSWPTDFTRDITPIPCHSHNDYWRRVPLFSAISAGFISVEADVWLFEEKLYVGHSTSSLTPDRTFEKLYVDPIMELLAKQNPTTQFHPDGNTSLNGVFDTDPSQSLTLLVEFKTDGPATWPYVMDALAPLREHNYLTHWNGNKLVAGPVVVVGTGNTPFGHVISDSTNPHHDIFLDAPLDEMWEDGASAKEFNEIGPGETHVEDNTTAKGLTNSSNVASSYFGTYNATNSFYASIGFGESIGRMWQYQLSAYQLNLVRGQIKGAHRRGLKVRYWDTPDWPIGLRNHVWDILVKEGVDVLNVDDLKAATNWDWGSSTGYSR